VAPKLQYAEYDHFAYENKLVGFFHHLILKAGYSVCNWLIDNKAWYISFIECQYTTQSILGLPGTTPRFNVYDIRKPCEFGNLCYDFSPLDDLIARKDVREALKVGDRKWTDCDMGVHTAMLGDWMLDLQPRVSYALERGVNFLVYSGDKDFICNWRGSEAWTNAIEWEHQEAFQSMDYTKWNVDGQPAGEYKRRDNLTFLRVYEAGHMVPMDQPKVALEMLRQFIANDVHLPITE
jgi:cathepsin A (carboxypeptidase C)